MKETTDKVSRMRLGWIIFIALAVLTGVEFLVGAFVRPTTPYLAATAIVKAWLIVHYFMHVPQLWRKDDKDE
jgi:membrane protein YdbS with pleckstrin-like domain